MAPFDILGSNGKFLYYLVVLLIGFGFGATLEMSGFGDSRKLAAQFYLKDMTVLKVMFTAIIVAMTLIFLSSSIGILDFRNVYVNVTFLTPQVIGGLILGVGFIIGGFCPGTSIVSASTFKIDGMFFIGGVFFGVFIFGEAFPLFQGLYNAGTMGRFTLPELFNTSYGVIVIAVLFMAFAMFWGAELSEKYFGEKKDIERKDLIPSSKFKIIGVATLLFFGLITAVIGQPTVKDHWNWIKKAELKKIKKRSIYVHPGELIEVMNDAMVYKNLIDVRDETSYNLFHLENAINISYDNILSSGIISKLLSQPTNSVNVLISNNELIATKAYKLLRAKGVINLYILSGGINYWLDLFILKKTIAKKIQSKPVGDTLNYRFKMSVGERVLQSNPGVDTKVKLVFKRKVKIQKKKAISGGCG